MALSGNDFGLAIGAFALSTMPDMFSNFEGGIIDAASLGFLQIDRFGNVIHQCCLIDYSGPVISPLLQGEYPRFTLQDHLGEEKHD